ncbi:hypothetical protein [uncultured Campylobacter sp.]|uniref:hypothetical protein n=1 Tax=uncultured Campylobacter sp. TaxID=218934 RepID=UPI00261DDE6E|nr:hypothetical protein [uncultured Campylobacter sp.]
MKTFIKILKITALVVSVACVLFVLYIFVILNLLFSSDTPEGCDPSMPTSACDYIDEKFEKELQNLPPVAALPPLDKRPVFWLGEKKFAGGAKFDYLYIKDDFGVWLRYEDSDSDDFLLQKDMPELYYGYDEIDRSPDLDWVKRELGYYRYGIYDISLFENEAKIFSQTAYKVVRKFIGFFNLHSMRGTSFAAPQGTEENLNAISELQTPLADFPQKPNYSALGWADKPEARGYVGDEIAKKLARNVFEIEGDGWRQTIRINSRAKDIKVICGDEICLALAFDESEINSCDNGAASTAIYTLNLKQKFNNFHTLTSRNFNYVKLGDKYTLDDVESLSIL